MKIENEMAEIEINTFENYIKIEESEEKCTCFGFNGCTPQQIAQLVHELSALAWISVEDELPKDEGFYQIKEHDNSSIVFEDYFNGIEFEDYIVTHWQPLAKSGK